MTFVACAEHEETLADQREMLARHRDWLSGLKGGVRADLSHRRLVGWVARDALLAKAKVAHCNLHYARLTGAVLAGADLTGANLEDAFLINVDLRGADLSRANLRNAALSGADLTDAILPIADIPVVARIDAAILAAVEMSPELLNMASWHATGECGTSHCRAGWAITLAGAAGRKLEDAVGPGAAGALIYAVSRPGMRVPNFAVDDDEALADLRACAAAG